MIFPYYSSHSYLITFILSATAAIFSSRQVTNNVGILAGGIIEPKVSSSFTLTRPGWSKFFSNLKKSDGHQKQQETDYSSFSPSFSPDTTVDNDPIPIPIPIGLSMLNQGSLISTSGKGDRIIDFAPVVGGGDDDFSPIEEFKNFPAGKADDDNRGTTESSSDLAFLDEDSSNPLLQVPEAIRGIPPAIFKIFGNTLQEFDDLGRRQWLRNVAQPNCKQGTFAFCCNAGPPSPDRVQHRYRGQDLKTTAKEILTRRRKCSKCTLRFF